MENVFIYIVQSVLATAILCGYYQVFLKNKKHHRLNRAFLILFFPLGLLLPLIHVTFLPGPLPSSIAEKVFEISESKWSYILVGILPAIYFFVSMSLLAIVVISVHKVLQLRKQSSIHKEKNFCLVETTDDRAPFSFFNNLFWKKGVDRNAGEGAKIFLHEMAHIIQHHSYDRLACQLTCAVCWMNPFFWWAQRELGTIHEFLADEKSFAPDETDQFARTLLSSYSGGRDLYQHIGFSKSDIARRIRMIGKSVEKQSWILRSSKGFVLLSCLVIILIANSYPTHTPRTDDEQKKIEAFEKKLRDERSQLVQKQ